MTTKQAFEKLINTPGWHKLSGIKENTARTIKKRFNDGTLLSLEAQFELLKAAGYEVKIKWKAG
jgi:hypothetical protein